MKRTITLLFHRCLVHTVVHIQAKYRIDRNKSGLLGIGFADYVQIAELKAMLVYHWVVTNINIPFILWYLIYELPQTGCSCQAELCLLVSCCLLMHDTFAGLLWETNQRLSGNGEPLILGISLIKDNIKVVALGCVWYSWTWASAFNCYPNLSMTRDAFSCTMMFTHLPLDKVGAI